MGKQWEKPDQKPGEKKQGEVGKQGGDIGKQGGEMGTDVGTHKPTEQPKTPSA